MDQCLICSRKVEGTLDEVQKFGQLNDLLRIFRISLKSLEQMQIEDEVHLDVKVFCAGCTELIQDGIYTLFRIESLQKDLKALQILIQSLMQNQIVNEDGARKTWVHNVRRMLVQCFSPCEVLINASALSEEKRLEEQRNAERVDGELTPSGSDIEMDGDMMMVESEVDDVSVNLLHYNNALKRLPEKGIPKEPSDSLFEQLSEVGSNEDQDSVKLEGDTFGAVEAEIYMNLQAIGHQKVQGTCDAPEVDSDNSTQKYDTAARISNDRWIQNENSMYVGFQCGVCNVELSRGDYRTRPGRFTFQCAQKTCGKVFRRFRHLCSHHKLHCWGKRRDSYNRAPKQMNLTVLPWEVSQKQNKEASKQLPPATTTLQSFPNKNSSTEHKTKIDFFNLLSHTASDSPPNPADLEKVSQKKLHSETTVPSTEGQNSTRKLRTMDNGYICDGVLGVVAFECPTCKLQFTRSDFQTDFAKFLFKCPEDPCTKTMNSFPTLCTHHRTHCPDNMRGSSGKFDGWRNQDGNFVTESGREFSRAGRLVAFKCQYCKKRLSSADFFDESTYKHIFNCPPSCCGRVFGSLGGLMIHHDAQCGWKIRVKTLDSKAL